MTQKPTTRGPCPYCGESQPYLRREHVIPQAFGVFERNLIAWDVCDTCNEFFGRTLDRVLARESYEGYLRVQTGLKPASDFTPPRDGSRVRTYGKAGPWRGMELRARIDPATGEMVQQPVRQIGFARSPTDSARYYPADRLPAPAQVRALLGPGELYMRAVGFDSAESVTAVLESAGFTDLQHVGRDPEIVTAGTTIRVERKIIADRLVLRGVAKIAMNYLAATFPALARLAQFRAMRDYVRYDRDPGYRAISLNAESAVANQPNGKRILGHVLTLRHHADIGAVIASVSLFNQMRYDVKLSPSGFMVTMPSEFMTTGHLFDTANRVVLDLAHKSLLAQRLIMRTDSSDGS